MGQSVVTGGCGFIGSHLVDQLIAVGEEVRVLDDLSSGRVSFLNARAKLIEGDIADPVAIRKAFDGADVCYHLAAVASVRSSIDAWQRSSHANLQGSVAIFEACTEVNVPVVYASSAAVYGLPLALPSAETAPSRPLSPYGVDKLAMEWHARVGGQCRGLRSVGLRFFNVFGPRQLATSAYSGVISIFIDRAKQGADLVIFGDGYQTRDFVHVRDVVEALRRAAALASTNAPVLNVSTNHPTSLNQLARAIIAQTASSSAIAHAPPRLGDIQHSVGDNTLLKAVLGWAPTIGLDTGLRSLISG